MFSLNLTLTAKVGLAHSCKHNRASAKRSLTSSSVGTLLASGVADECNFPTLLPVKFTRRVSPERKMALANTRNIWLDFLVKSLSADPRRRRYLKQRPVIPFFLNQKQRNFLLRKLRFWTVAHVWVVVLLNKFVFFLFNFNYCLHAILLGDFHLSPSTFSSPGEEKTSSAVFFPIKLFLFVEQRFLLH